MFQLFLVVVGDVICYHSGKFLHLLAFSSQLCEVASEVSQTYLAQILGAVIAYL